MGFNDFLAAQNNPAVLSSGEQAVAAFHARVELLKNRWANEPPGGYTEEQRKAVESFDVDVAGNRGQQVKMLDALRHRERHDEMFRVLSLPAVDYSDAPDFTDVLLKDVNKRTWRDGQEARLRPVQNQMLAAARDANGGYFMAGTGKGKSFTAILAGSVMRDVQRVLIFTPASTVGNLTAEYFRLRNLFKVPEMRKVLNIYSTEELSKAREEHDGDLLDELIWRNGGKAETTLVVFDEAHRLKNLTSARGGRVMRAMLKHEGLRVIVMSGTMTSKSVLDAAHLAWYALREGSPYPVQWAGPGAAKEGHRMLQLEALAACTDVDGIPTQRDWKEVQPLVLKYFPQLESTYWQIPTPTRTSLVRQAFQKRLLSTRGVVLTTDAEIPGLSLFMDSLKPEVPQLIWDALQQLESGTDFNDMPIPDASTAARLRKQIVQGFYYIWDWPKDRAGIPIVDLDWKAARSRWAKCVRTEVQNSARTGYDSEMLIYNSIKRAVLALCTEDLEREWVEHIARTTKDNKTWEDFAVPAEALGIWHRLRKRAGGNDLLQAWLDWSAIEKHKEEPPVKGVWLSTFLLEHVVAWAKAQPDPPIIWYEHREVGAKLQSMGIPAFGAGTEPPKQACICALSIAVHSEGKNLQDRWYRQVVLCPPSSGVRWEQMLGRTYRDGQELRNPIVYCHVYQHDNVFIDALNTARSMAAYAEDQGNKQKLLFAKYSKSIKLHKITYGSDIEAIDNFVDRA